MPELPEVQTIVNGLNERVAGAAIVGVWCDWKKMVVEPRKWEEFEKLLLKKGKTVKRIERGKRIKTVKRVGKFIVFELEGDLELFVHLRMTGHFLIIDDEKRKDKGDPIYEKVNNYIHFKLILLDGREIALSDLRKFGKIYLTSKPLSSLPRFWVEAGSAMLRGEGGISNIGADPLKDDFTLDKFLSIMENRKGNIKQVLMDQALIAGIGNIYSSEILWEAGISPLRKAESLNEDELKRIFKAIGKILRYAIKMRGDSESDYRDVDGREGGYQKVQRVYQRDGEKCYRCGGIIQRVKIGQRSGFYCSGCQK